MNSTAGQPAGTAPPTPTDPRVRTHDSRPDGTRIVVVIDDECSAVNFNGDGKNNLLKARGTGLNPLAVIFRDHPETRAVGFFPLPEAPKSDRDATPQDVDPNDAVTPVVRWLESYANPAVSVYIVLDCYNRDNLFVGDRVYLTLRGELDRLRRRFSRVEVGFLSAGTGREGFRAVLSESVPESPEVQHMLFIKGDLPITPDLSSLPPDLKNFFGLATRLERLWGGSAEWFRDDDPSTEVPHEATVALARLVADGQGDTSRTPTLGAATAPVSAGGKYRAAITRQLDGLVTEAWWAPESVGVLHKVLKRTCGSTCLAARYQPGQPDHEDAKGNALTFGSVVLLALLAHREVCGTTPGSLLPDGWHWGDLDSKVALAPFMPAQSPARAHASALALYRVFLAAFTHQSEKTKAAAGIGGSAVRELTLSPGQRRGTILLNWSAEVSPETPLSALVSAAAAEPNDRVTNQTTTAVTRLWASLLHSKTGFAGPGVLYMSGDKIVFGTVSGSDGSQNAAGAKG